MFYIIEATVQYYEHCLATAFQYRRLKLAQEDGTDPAVIKPGGVLFDKFTGNEATSGGHQRRREAFSRKNSIRLLDAIPGHGSAENPSHAMLYTRTSARPLMRRRTVCCIYKLEETQLASAGLNVTSKPLCYHFSIYL